MPRYFVDARDPMDGTREVHRQGCHRMPAEEDCEPLGEFDDARDAVREARRTWAEAKGCYFCCLECQAP